MMCLRERPAPFSPAIVLPCTFVATTYSFARAEQLPEQPARDHLALAAVVDVGRVEEDDAALDRAPHDRLGGLLVERPRALLVAAVAHHPEADPRDAEARPAEVHVLHARTLPSGTGRARQKRSSAYAGSGSGDAAPISSSAGACTGRRVRGMKSAAVPAPTATTAETANACVKPASVGIPATALAASTVADTCEPSEAPTERTSALKPVASPVCSGGTTSMIEFGIAANARPIPADMMRLKTTISNRLPCATARRPSPVAVRKPPIASGTLFPTRLPMIPESGPSASIASDPGSSSRPAFVASTPKP